MRSPTPRRKPARRPTLFEAVLCADDRDRIAGARPLLSISAQDERAYQDEVARHARASYTLERRGVWHGEWVELDPEHLPRAALATSPLAERWHAARPCVLAGAARAELGAYASELGAAAELHERLKEPHGLERWIASRAAALAPSFIARGTRGVLADPERDLERVYIESLHPADIDAHPSQRHRRVDDLWVKSAWLSSFADEDSLRVRVSFGNERDDDASRDLLRHRLVASLATELFPESALASSNPRIADVVASLCAQPVLFTQHIAYWNSPQGGALFHHDGFAEDAAEGARQGQLGVCYLQLTGATAWLALSIGDLAARVREFAQALDEGELAWVRAQLWPQTPEWTHLRKLVDDEQRLLRELALPGCGALGALVNRGPEFSAFLADAGHAAILHAGDAILLPNHDLAHTVMHSVFCASEHTGYALSLAIRPARETPLAFEC